MERDLADRETPFTDYRVEDRDGLPRAVFDRLPPEQSSLLSYFLYPDKFFIGNLYLEVLKISNKEIPWMSYEDNYVKTTFKPRSVVIETKVPVEQRGSRVKLKLPLGDVKFLLLKWRFECMRWEAIQWNMRNREYDHDGSGKNIDN